MNKKSGMRPGARFLWFLGLSFIGVMELIAWLARGMSETRALVASAAVMLIWLYAVFVAAKWADAEGARRRPQEAEAARQAREGADSGGTFGGKSDMP